MKKTLFGNVAIIKIIIYFFLGYVVLAAVSLLLAQVTSTNKGMNGVYFSGIYNPPFQRDSTKVSTNTTVLPKTPFYFHLLIGYGV